MILFIGCILASFFLFPYFRKGRFKYKVIFGISTVFVFLISMSIFRYFGVLGKWYVELFAPVVIINITNFIVHMLLFRVSAEYRYEHEGGRFN